MDRIQRTRSATPKDIAQKLWEFNPNRQHGGVCDGQDWRKGQRAVETYAQWPDALPHPHEEKIFSVVCGNTNIKWAVHEGVGMSFSPSCCWR
jgi:hypothetical protein